MPTLVSAERFGGLDLLTDPQEIGTSGAVDMLNVDLDRSGRLRTRSGLLAINTVVGTGYHTVFGAGTNSGELLAVRRSSTSLYLDKCDGTTAANVGNWAASSTALAHSWAALGTASTTTVYVTSLDTTTGYTVRKYNGSTIGTGTGKPGFVAVMPRSNRLAQGFYYAAADSPSGADGSRSTVFFSDPDTPDTYTSTNWVQLNPGDGEAITGMVTFGDDLWVFKQTKAYVFSGEDTDATGLPTFPYREVPLPEPLLSAPGYGQQYVIAGDDGIYIAARRGIYKTVGGPPVRISGPVDRIFTNDTTLPSALRCASIAPQVAWAGGRLFVSYQNLAADIRTLVYDPSGFWLVWDIDVSRYVDWPAVTYPDGNSTNVESREVWIAGADGYFYSISQDQTTDQNTSGSAAISWSYQSGWYDLGAPGQEKVVRRSRLTGTGTVTLSRFADYATSDSNAGSVALGSTMTTLPHAKSWRGTLMSHKFSGTGAVELRALEHEIRSVRPVGIRSA